MLETGVNRLLWGTRSRWRPLAIILAASLTLFTAAGPAGANQGSTPDSDPPKAAMDLGHITVISTQPGVDISPDKTVIKMDEFQRPAGVRTLTDVLTAIGGVDVQRVNPLMASPGDEVSIRGLNEGRMVIEIDGRRINHTGHFGRYIVDWSTLSMDDVERVEIIRGGHSVLHPFAIGGVINIITKKGKKTGEIKPEIKVQAGYGSFHTHFQEVSINGGVGNWMGYYFSFSDGHTDGYLRNNYQDNTSINGHVSFYMPRGMQLTYSVKHSNVEYGYPVLNDPSRADYDPDYPKFFGSADQLRHVPPTTQTAGPHTPYWDRDTTYQDLIFKAPVGEAEFKLHFFSTLGKRWNHYYRGQDFKEDFSGDLTRGVIAQFGNLNLGEHHSVTFGVEYQELGSPGQDATTIGWPEMDLATYKVFSLYIQDVIRYGKWTITPGVRYYHLDMRTYYAWFESGGDAPAFPTSGKEQSESDIFPSLKIDFQATPSTALYAAVSRSYRLPCP